VAGLEVVVVGGAGVTGLERKLGTTVLATVVGGSGFMVEAVAVVGDGLAKKFGTADCAGAGTVVDAGAANKFFAGSFVSVVVVVPVVGFGCVGAVEGGVNKVGVMVLVVEVAGLNEIAGAGVEAVGGFFSSSVTFFWS
jgi:hypothetical protein